MDYDGNDFQSQNFQLSGEDNNRFSSGLRSYSLPKFELDEHYQVHLRFDSVVEPESLLGIQDQEENSWIQDFSSGNGTLGFTLSAAEPCSISRRKNVWSEATSSESVEILLRSVGEDDMISKETDIFDLEAHNGLSSASTHMDPSSVPDVVLQSKAMKAMNADHVLPPDENEKDLSRINKSTASELPDVEDACNTFNDEELKSEMFEELDEGRKGSTCGDLPKQCNLTEIITLPTVESFAPNEKAREDSSVGNAVTDHQLDDVFVEKNAANDLNISPTLVAEGSQDATREQIDPLTSPPNSSCNDSLKISAKQVSEQVAEDNHGAILMVMSQKLAMDDDHKIETGVVTSSSGNKNEPSEACKINHSHDILESSSTLEPKAESSSFLMEECNAIASEKSHGLLEEVTHQIDVLSKDKGMSGQVLMTSHEACSLVIGGEINMGGHSIRNNLDDTGQSVSLNIDSFDQAKGGSADAIFETKVPLEKDDLHVGNVLPEKNTMGTEDCAARELEKPVIIAEGNEDAQSHPSGMAVEISDSSVELHNSKITDCGARGAKKKEDMGINVPEPPAHWLESSLIQNSVEGEAREKNRVIVDDMLDTPEQVLQESADPPNLPEEKCENGQMSPLQDATSPEKSNIIHEPECENSGIHGSLLPCIRSSASPDNLDSHMKGKPQGAPTQTQTTQAEADHMEGQSSGETNHEVTAGGDASTVSAWHLRSSLIWKDGHWVEWSRPREDTLHLHEVDTPQEKRHKSSRLDKENNHENQNISSDKLPANIQVDHANKPEESRPLLLSECDKIFAIGKNSNEENNQGTLRTKRTGQKEGSRVVFGVPRPGKKRKFMEVSKHYVTGKINNVSEGSDATKHSKHLPPQASGGWRNTSRVDPKGRKGAEPRPRVMRPVKAQSTQIKSATEREGSFVSSVSASNGVGLSQCSLPTVKSSSSHDEKLEKTIMESTSFTNNFVREESTASEASMRSLPGIPTSRKKAIITTESDVGTKGKVASALEKTKSEEKNSVLADYPGKVIADASELRRSSRRIQPTSRLLEGLQSSMIISKIPTVSHEKGARAYHPHLPSSKGNIHG